MRTCILVQWLCALGSWKIVIGPSRLESHYRLLVECKFHTFRNVVLHNPPNITCNSPVLLPVFASASMSSNVHVSSYSRAVTEELAACSPQLHNVGLSIKMSEDNRHQETLTCKDDRDPNKNQPTPAKTSKGPWRWPKSSCRPSNKPIHPPWVSNLQLSSLHFTGLQAYQSCYQAKKKIFIVTWPGPVTAIVHITVKELIPIVIAVMLCSHK